MGRVFCPGRLFGEGECFAFIGSGEDQQAQVGARAAPQAERWSRLSRWLVRMNGEGSSSSGLKLAFEKFSVGGWSLVSLQIHVAVVPDSVLTPGEPAWNPVVCSLIPPSLWPLGKTAIIQGITKINIK